MNRRKAEWKHIEKEHRETGRRQVRCGSRFGMKQQTKGAAAWKPTRNS